MNATATAAVLQPAPAQARAARHSRAVVKKPKRHVSPLAGGKPAKPALPIAASPPAEFRELPIEAIDPSPLNPRDDAAEDLDQLLPSIEAADVGVVTPITVRPLSPTRWEVVCGERRLLAAKAAGKTTIAVVVRNLTDDQALELSLIENLCRKGLNPMQIARGIRRLKGAPAAGKTMRQIGALFGKSVAWVERVSRLTTLPLDWQRKVADGELRWDRACRLLPLIKHPELLAEVERQMSESPGLWESEAGYRRGLALIKERIGQPAGESPQQPKPPRAPQSRLSPTPADAEVVPPATDAESVVAPAASDGERAKGWRDLGREAAAAATEARADLVEQIVVLIGQIETWKQLDRVKKAIKTRAAELAK